MVSKAPSADVDWRPYWATGTVLVAALGLNAWTGNALWAWYTAIGLGALLWLVGLARTGAFRFPTRALWFVGLAGGLHYAGGSLSGLHGFGVNGLYYVFPWWDNVVHALGVGAVAAGAAAMLEGRLGDSPRLWWFLAACAAITAGVAVELYEFAQFVFFGTVDQGFYTNTLLDLYDNVVGAVVGAGVYVLTSAPGRVQAKTMSASPDKE